MIEGYIEGIKDKKLRRYAIKSLLQSYFDDLIEYMENTNRLERFIYH